MSHSPSRRARLVAVTAIAVAVPVLLAGCLPPGGVPIKVDDDFVSFDDAQTATIQLEAEGNFVLPGTLEEVDRGSRGSGFIIDGDGLAITNNHVVAGAGSLKVWIGGDTTHTVGAEILGASECLDLAVIRVEGADLPHFGWYEGEIKTALDVYSAGFPLGDPVFTMTRGIVSKADVPKEDSWASLDHVIEHDARIRGGNSSGPLIAANGRVVGVNYAGNDTLDYSFAIHRDEVLPMIEDLAAGKPVLSLGVNAKAIEPAEDGSPLGVWVSSVQAGGPAERAGVLPGDVLTELGGITLARGGSLEEYCEVVRTQGSEATIDVTLYRPSDNSTYEGQMNGDEVVKVGGSEPDPVDPVGSFVTISDDSGILSVDVPDSWSDVASGLVPADNGAQFLSLSASPSLVDYNGTWGTPGLSLSSTQDPTVTPQEYVDGYQTGIGNECENAEQGDYDDGLYAGRYVYFTNCGGVGTDYVALAVRDVDDTHFVLLTVQMVSDEDKTVVLDQVLKTFFAQY